MPDFKYYKNETALEYSKIKNYFNITTLALKEMKRQVGNPVFDDNGIIEKAQEAANATEEAAKNDQAAINGLLNEMDSIINGIGGGNVPVIGSINGKITWSTGSATLTLTADVEGVTIQYRKNSESNWTNYTSAVPSLLHGDKVYARGIKGGETVINEKEFKIQDTIAPTVTIANASSTTNSICLLYTSDAADD